MYFKNRYVEVELLGQRVLIFYLFGYLIKCKMFQKFVPIYTFSSGGIFQSFKDLRSGSLTTYLPPQLPPI